MGFRESASHETGMERLWKRLRPLADASTIIVTPYEWDENLAGLASFILRNSVGGAEVMVIGYSWGCGVGFENFAREAAAKKLTIPVAVLCDPVFRSRIFPTWLPFNPWSITPILRPKILVPRCVRRVEWLRQSVSVPSGHDLVAEDPERTYIAQPAYLQIPHTEIDDSDEFHCLAERLAVAFVHDTLES
jgi:hypothetical protein